RAKSVCTFLSFGINRKTGATFPVSYLEIAEGAHIRSDDAKEVIKTIINAGYLLAVSPGPGRGRKPVYVPAKDGVGYARKGGALPRFSAKEKGGYLTEKRGVSYGEKGGAPESFVQQSQGLRPPTSDNLCIPLMKQARKESDSVTVKEQNRTPERGFAPKEGKKEK